MDYRIGRSGGTLGNRDYFLEGELLESEYSGSNLHAKYFRGVSTDELVAAWMNDTDGKLKPFLFHHDNVTSTTAVSGHNGGTLQSTTFGAFGNTQSTTGTSPNRLKYTGREDDQTGLYYYRARYYDFGIGRFISEDPLGFEAGINFFAYVGNNPINANDPSGLDTRVSIGYTRTAVPGTNHQLVILTDTVTGQQFATRAGPQSQGFSGSASNSSQSSSGGSFSASSGNGGSGGYGFGRITAIAKPFNADFKDVPSAVHTIQNVGVIQRDFADVRANAIEFANVTNKNNIPYFPTGPNSNSYASTFVQSLTGSRPQPIVTAPGADMGRPSSSLSFKPSPFVSGNAGGGFLLYPNKSNTNMTQSVYAK
jgi:RHS repeat-associated protein